MNEVCFLFTNGQFVHVYGPVRRESNLHDFTSERKLVNTPRADHFNKEKATRELRFCNHNYSCQSRKLQSVCVIRTSDFRAEAERS